MRIRSGCFLLVLGVLLSLTTPAQACSCAGGGDPRERLEQAAAAFIGRAVSQPSPSPTPVHTADAVSGSYGRRNDIRFTVDEDFKSNLADEITVFGAASPCGFGAPVGKTVAMYLYRDNGRWTSSSCSQSTPEVLRRSAAPLPAPDGRGPPRFVMGGSMGPVRTFTLDAKGRTLTYAEGPGTTGSLDLCPGAAVVAELVQGVVDDKFWKLNVATRDVQTLALRSEYGFTSFETKNGVGSIGGGPVACLDAAGRTLAVFGVRHDGVGRIVRVTGEIETTIWEGKADAFEFSETRAKAFVAGGMELLEVDLLKGTTRKVARVPDGTLRLDVSPDDAHAIYSSTGGERKAERGHYVVDLTTGRSQRLPLKLNDYLWADPREFIAVTKDRAVHVFDLRLRETANWPDWGGRGVVDTGVLYESSYAGLRSASVRTGPPRVLRHFDFDQSFTMVVVPTRDRTDETPSAAPMPTAQSSPPATPAPQSLPSAAPASGGAAQTVAVFAGAVALAGVAYALKRRRPADR